MEDGAREMRIASLASAEAAGRESAGEGRFTDAELDAARDLAEYHRTLAVELEPQSPMRGLVLRCAGHWSRLGAIPRNGLASIEDETW